MWWDNVEIFFNPVKIDSEDVGKPESNTTLLHIPQSFINLENKKYFHE